MKRRLAAGGVALSLLAILGIGTAAYFVTSGRAENKITMGTVDLTLTETVNGDVVDESTHQLNGILPGQTVEQVAKIENSGNQDYWLRVRANVNITAADWAAGADTALDPGVISFNWDEEQWMERDGWYYYPTAVAAGETVTPFDTVSFAPEAGNEYQGCTIDIDVEAQAVQVKNNAIPEGGSVLDVQGWPEPVTP